jgi:hypothetical protein
MFMKHIIEKSESEIRKIFAESDCKSEVSRSLGYDCYGGGALRYINVLIYKYKIDISHFDGGKARLKLKNTKYPIITKKCPNCGKMFKTSKGSKGEKTTCSHGCANSYFRSEKGNPNFKGFKSKFAYRRHALKHYGEKCENCGYNKHEKILQVHHIDGDRLNNTVDNLIVLCPNCHSAITFKYAEMKNRRVEWI